MWKSVVLCASLFGSAALGLVMAARWIEPAALPAAGAIGLCLVGVVLILAAPPRASMLSGPAGTLQTPALDEMLPRNPPLSALDGEPATRATAIGTSRPTV
jgi:hypothetical protein